MNKCYYKNVNQIIFTFMIKTHFLPLLLIFSSLWCHAQWNYIRVEPVGNSIVRGLTCLDTNTCFFAASQIGVRTTDFFQSNVSYIPSAGDEIIDIIFVNPDTGFLVSRTPGDFYFKIESFFGGGSIFFRTYQSSNGFNAPNQYIGMHVSRHADSIIAFGTENLDKFYPPNSFPRTLPLPFRISSRWYSDSLMIVGGLRQIAYSTDHGLSWTVQNLQTILSMPQQGQTITSIARLSNGGIMIGGSFNLFAVTYDMGQTWINLSNPIYGSGRDWRTLEVLSDGVLIRHGLLSLSSGVLEYSTDNGLSWVQMTYPLVTYINKIASFNNSNRLIVTGYYSMIAWHPLRGGNGIPLITNLADPTPRPTITLSPNPFQGAVQVASPEPARYTLLSIAGQVLGQGSLPAGGGSLALQHLPAGPYVLQLHTASHSTTRRLVKQ